jgi:hypothetical protein
MYLLMLLILPLSMYVAFAVLIAGIPCCRALRIDLYYLTVMVPLLQGLVSQHPM